MGRSEQKAKERRAAQQRSLVTPIVPSPSEAQAPTMGKDLRRGGGVRGRNPQLPEMFKTRPIATPQGGERAKPKGRNIGATAKPPESPVSRGQNLPPSAAVPGTGPDGNKVGSDADPNTPGMQGSGAPGARTNANGLQQYGQTLGGLNAFTSAFTGGYEIADIKTAFQSEDLPVKGSRGTNTDYSISDAQAMGVSKPDALKIAQGGFVETTIDASTPLTTGNNPTNSQDGTSPDADIAESVRTLRMQRKGPRDDGGPRGFAIDRNNRLASAPKEEAPDEAKIAQQRRRNDIRSTFLDMDTPIIQASVAANAKAGYGKDSDGNARFNYGGELVYAKEGMQQKAKNAAMMGMNPSEFLDIPTTPDVQPDAPANNELSPAFGQVKPEVDAFFKKKMNAVKGTNK